MRKSAILFCKDSVESIEFDHRIPPSAIGARRVRASSKEVMKELRRQKRAKKEQKRSSIEESNLQPHRAVESKDVKKGNKSITSAIKIPTEKVPSDCQESEEVRVHINNVPLPEQKYFQLNVDSKLIQEEVDEIKGLNREASNNLPAFISAPMTEQALKRGLLPLTLGTLSTEVPEEGMCSNHHECASSNYKRHENSSHDTSSRCLKSDDDLARMWAEKLRVSMKDAEAVRAKEDMRPMAYQLVPEPWTRLRDSAIAVENDPDMMQAQNCENNIGGDIIQKHSSMVLFANSIRAVSNSEWYDDTQSIVYDCLYNQFGKLHISCGAKFGCHYLLYDGNRKVRHAFAGLRILASEIDSDGKINFNLPTAYNMHGYVRGLNTAGKLALIATVIPSMEKKGNFRVAIVDLALEKILTAPTHLRKRKRSEARKDIGQNLSKDGSSVK